MASSSFGILFLLSLLTGGASDLLDVIPADEYWRAKNVQVTDAFLRDELAPPPPIGDVSKLVDDLGDDQAAKRDAAADKIRAMGPAVVAPLLEAAQGGNPEVTARARRLAADVRSGGSKPTQVRKLMALRSAGERKSAALLPRLKELAATAPEPFVADYAAAAVAAIEGKPYARPRPAPSVDDVWLLPAATRAVVHMDLAGSGRIATTADLTRLLKSVPGIGMLPPPGGGPAPADADQAVNEQVRAMLGQVIAVAERVGNARVDGVTMGIAGDVGNNSGYVAFVVRGQYDAKAVGDYLAEVTAGPADRPPPVAPPGGKFAKREAVAGVDVIRPASSVAIELASDTHAGFVAGPGPKQMPVEELATLLKAGRPGPLKDVPEMAKLVGQIDPSLPMWGAASMTPAYRQALLFRSLDSLVLTARPKGQGVAVRVDAVGQNGPSVADAVAMVNQGVATAKQTLKMLFDAMAEPETKRLVKVGLGVLESLKCAADAADPTQASLTAEIDAPPATLLLGMVGGVAAQRFEMRPVPPPPAQVVPAPAPPQ